MNALKQCVNFSHIFKENCLLIASVIFGLSKHHFLPKPYQDYCTTKIASWYLKLAKSGEPYVRFLDITGEFTLLTNRNAISVAFLSKC